MSETTAPLLTMTEDMLETIRTGPMSVMDSVLLSQELDAQRAARARERGTCATCRHWNQMAPFACDAGVSTKYPSWAKDAKVPMNPPSNFGCNRHEPSLVAAPRALAPSPGDAHAD